VVLLAGVLFHFEVGGGVENLVYFFGGKV